MAITNISTDWGIYPRIVRIVSTDTIGVITRPGYLTAQQSNIQAIQNGMFQWTPNDFVAISYNGGKGLFNVDYLVNNTFTPLTNGIYGISLTLTSAQILGAYARPVEFIPAAGPNTMISLVTSVVGEFNFVSTQYTNGGDFGLQYGNAPNLAGTRVGNLITAATINGYTADNVFIIDPIAANNQVGLLTNYLNRGIYVSNATAAFTAGNGIITLNANFSIINTTL